jgi:hypothetical protein
LKNITRRREEFEMNEVLIDVVGGLRIGDPISCGSLHLFPLSGRASGEGDFLLLSEALERKTLRVEELDGGGSVPELRVVNGGAEPVLVLEGDELAGAKQNRAVNSSVLVPAHSEFVLPVSCIERGRWSRSSRPLNHEDGSPHLTLRRLKSRAVHASLKRGRGHRSDQGAVWEEVDRKMYRHAAASPTHALRDTRLQVREQLDAFRALSGKIPEDARGVVVALGGRPVFTEILAGPRSFSRVRDRLLSGYAFEAIEWEETDPPGVSGVSELLASVMRAGHEEYSSVGAGRDVRFASPKVSGYALVHGESVLHAAAFAS